MGVSKRNLSILVAATFIALTFFAYTSSFNVENIQKLSYTVEKVSKADIPQRKVYIDMGANWANTLDWGMETNKETKSTTGWDIYAFEASVYIAPYVDKMVNYLNGHGEMPVLDFPITGSTPDLLAVSAEEKAGCEDKVKDHDAYRRCMYEKYKPSLLKLRPSPELLEDEEIQKRMKSCHSPNMNPEKNAYHFIPAAVGTAWEKLKFNHLLLHFLIGGANNVDTWDLNCDTTQDSHDNQECISFDIRVADVIAWIDECFTKDDFVSVKIDVEGAEFGILNKMMTDKMEKIDQLGFECHGKGGNCSLLKQDLAEKAPHIEIIHFH